MMSSEQSEVNDGNEKARALIKAAMGVLDDIEEQFRLYPELVNNPKLIAVADQAHAAVRDLHNAIQADLKAQHQSDSATRR